MPNITKKYELVQIPITATFEASPVIDTIEVTDIGELFVNYKIKSFGAIDAHISIEIEILYHGTPLIANIEEDLVVEFSLRDEMLKLQPSSLRLYRADESLTEDQIAEIKDCLACYISFTINS